MRIPDIYRDGYDKARSLNPSLADTYMEHTMIGDPEADAVIEELAQFDQQEVHRLIHACMQQDAKALADAPPKLRDFFHRIEEPPAWFDPDAVYPGCRAFHAYSDLFIPAFFVVTLQNAATLISKAFYMTGRVTTEFGLRRIKQNTRHFIEIMLPGALDRQGEGWKLSVRIRLVHAQVRRLLRESDDWDEAVYGVPISAAHLGLASANFSATMLQQADRLGAHLDAEARQSFMQIWRYASYLIGTPESLLFEGDEARTAELYRIGAVCEPLPGDESAAIAHRPGQRRSRACRPHRYRRAAQNGAPHLPRIARAARKVRVRLHRLPQAANDRLAHLAAVEAPNLPRGAPHIAPNGAKVSRAQLRIPARRIHAGRPQLPPARPPAR